MSATNYPKGENFLYTNGRSVIIRNIKDPYVSSAYTEHAAPATVARYSPSGFYIASGDERGNVRVWDTINAEHILKNEARALAGRVNDIAWCFESKRIVAVGEGKDSFARAFTFDSGSTVGEMSGHSKTVNAVAQRPSRPFKTVTASDDMSVNFYPGVPYKFEKSLNAHTRFVQCVRYSPNSANDYFVSAGMDAKLFIFDGKTGEKTGELVDGSLGNGNAHNGGIFSISFNKDGSQLISASSDGTVKLWNVVAKTLDQTFVVGSDVESQQVGCLWQGDFIISLSLNGDINYFQKGTAAPVKIVKGHQKAITALATVPSANTFYTGSYDGRVHAWSFQDGKVAHHNVSGAGHTNQVKGLVAEANGKVVSIGLDDSVRSIDNASKTFTAASVGTSGAPASVDSRDGVTVVATQTGNITVIKNGVPSTLSVSYVPTAVALNPAGTFIAVGDEERRVRIYNLDLQVVQEIEQNRGSITVLAFSPDGTMLASADKDRMILVFNTSDWTVKITQWMFHNARVNSISWSPDSLHAVSGSLDTNVEVWSVEKPTKHISIKGAHLEGVNATAFLDNNTVVSAGQDGSIKIWKIVHH
ncbi:WD40 repeat-like protein [Rhizoclosmatium globosum]|uniref:WD40 repeat-like protein n=1 Tax=Rhizoclosmatium globosum TaxID=329046 RepID=A0A1Y2BSH4_9FUNG|nr:WD40 repeat-like protein [Rhizoclosmatium globosum]|eukprot:ORY37693.1 WD40 repeat-like protein [Rhizoclosmatium globosum]